MDADRWLWNTSLKIIGVLWAFGAIAAIIMAAR